MLKSLFSVIQMLYLHIPGKNFSNLDWNETPKHLKTRNMLPPPLSRRDLMQIKRGGTKVIKNKIQINVFISLGRV